MPVTKTKKRGGGGKARSKSSQDGSGGARLAPPSRTSHQVSVQEEPDDGWKSPLSDEARERRQPRSIMTVLAMAFNFSVDEEWTRVTFPELPTFIFWARQIVAISAAAVCGIAPVIGLPALLIWALLDLGGVWLYLHRLTMVQLAQGDDDETGEGGGEGSTDFESFKLQSLMMEGLTASIANFLFFWTFFYNLFHASGPLGDESPEPGMQGSTEDLSASQLGAGAEDFGEGGPTDAGVDEPGTEEL